MAHLGFISANSSSTCCCLPDDDYSPANKSSPEEMDEVSTAKKKKRENISTGQPNNHFPMVLCTLSASSLALPVKIFTFYFLLTCVPSVLFPSCVPVFLPGLIFPPTPVIYVTAAGFGFIKVKVFPTFWARVTYHPCLSVSHLAQAASSPAPRDGTDKMISKS